MKPLPVDFESKGFIFHQISRSGDVALYRKGKNGHDFESFEVIRVQKSPEYTIANVTVPAHEHFPNSEKWGDLGWSLTSKAAALDKMSAVYKLFPESSPLGVPTGKPKGKPRSSFELEPPTEGQFTVKDLESKYPDQSVAMLHLRLNELKNTGRVEVVGTKRTESGRGKPMNVYRAVPLDFLPQEALDAQITRP